MSSTKVKETKKQRNKVNREYTVAVIGSHSALDVCRGAKDEGFKTLVIVEKGRDKTYAKYYKSIGNLGCVDDVLSAGARLGCVFHGKVREVPPNRSRSRVRWRCGADKLSHIVDGMDSFYDKGDDRAFA